MFALVMGLLTYIFIHIVFLIKNLSVKPKCKILYLHKNEICMKPQFQHGKSKTEDYLKDIDTICKYAKSKKKLKVIINTHVVIVNELIKKYVHDNEKYNEFSTLSENKEIRADSDLGELEITYSGERINRCARYKYSIIKILSAKERRRIIEKRQFYHIVINLK